jgi:hypothetical protein
MPEPKGLRNIWNAGIDATTGLLGIPKTVRTLLYVGLAIGGLCLIVMVSTACWGVGSGKIDVNRLAESSVKGLEAGGRLYAQSKGVPV